MIPFRLSLLLALLVRFFEFSYIFERKLTRLRELRHHELGAPSEENKNLVKKTMSCCFPSHRRLENVSIADLPETAHDLFPFEPIYDRLDGRVRGARLRKGLLNLPDGGISVGPEDCGGAAFASSSSSSANRPSISPGSNPVSDQSKSMSWISSSSKASAVSSQS